MKDVRKKSQYGIGDEQICINHLNKMKPVSMEHANVP